MIKQQTVLAMIVTSVLALGTIGSCSFAMGQSNDSSNLASNQTNIGGEPGNTNAVKMQINEALTSLESNDLSGALAHLQDADKNSSGQLHAHRGCDKSFRGK